MIRGQALRRGAAAADGFPTPASLARTSIANTPRQDQSASAPEDILKFVARHTTSCLQRAWAVEKECDIALRLKRHIVARDVALRPTERESLRLVIRVVTESGAPPGSDAATHLLLRVSSASHQQSTSKSTTRQTADGDAKHDPFSVNPASDISAVLKSLTVAYQVCELVHSIVFAHDL